MSRSLFPTVLLGMISVIGTNTEVAKAQVECPYPCLPPPTSGGTIASYPPPPPAATGGGSDGFGGSYPPPPPGSYQQLTPPGVMPGFVLAPPYSSIPTGPAPPPPNPVLPWYPWYYQHENPITGSTTSSASSPLGVHRRSMRVASLVLPPCLVIILLRASL